MSRNELEKFQKFLAPVSIQCENIVLALTHPSFVGEQKNAHSIAHNQRLEFLGDAVLDWLSAEFLYRNFPDAGEGWMTQKRSLLVSRQALYELALDVDLPSAMKLGKGEEKLGGRSRLSTISDAMEAVVGAIFLELGEASIKKWAQRKLYDFWYKRISTNRILNPKGMLQELFQEQGLPLPTYELVSETGPEHAKMFEVRIVSQGIEIGRGQGTSKKNAETNAAINALSKYSSLT